MKVKEYLTRWFKTTDVMMPSYYDGRTRQPGYTDTHIMRPRIVCRDGFTVSVQADKHRCCEPRGNKLDGSYTHVELISPSKADTLIDEYAVDKKNLTDTVYPYVPVSVVDKLLEKHGGIKGPDPVSMEQLSKCFTSKHMKQRVSW